MDDHNVARTILRARVIVVIWSLGHLVINLAALVLRIRAMSTPNSVVQSRDLSAILFADMHGYSRLMSKDEEGTRQRVARSIGLIKPLIGDYGGPVMNVAGDGVLALFGSASQAIKFAIEIQREFRDATVWHPLNCR